MIPDLEKHISKLDPKEVQRPINGAVVQQIQELLSNLQKYMDFAQKRVRVKEEFTKEKRIAREIEEKKKEDMIIRQVKDQLPSNLKFTDDQIPQVVRPLFDS